MTYAETILPEFDQEMANTRKVLERIPDDRLDWQPHPKSHTIGWNANHVADLPTGSWRRSRSRRSTSLRSAASRTSVPI